MRDRGGYQKLAELEALLVELCDGRASAAVVPEIGGALAWFRWEEGGQPIDWLRPADDTAFAARDPGGMACFPLVPYSNRVRDGRFTFAGRAIRLPVSPADPHFEHGHGWRRPWTLEHRDRARAVLRYRHEPDAWPWCYEAEQDIRLSNGVLAIRLTLRNLSDSRMPAGIGLHPYFPASPDALVETEFQTMWETDAEVLPVRCVPTTARMIEVASAALDNVFTGWSRQARLAWPRRGISLDLSADAPLDFLVLYTPAGASFFCAEPVSNATDAFNLAAGGDASTGLITIAPGAERSASVSFAPRLTRAN